MTQTVQKWGNSLAVRIPAAIARRLEIEEGSKLELRIDGDRLVVAKIDPLPEFTSDALERALRDAQRQLVEFGPPRGNEEL